MQTASFKYKDLMKLPIRNRGYIRATLGVVNTDAQNSAGFGSRLYPDYPTPEKIFNSILPSKIYAMPEMNFSKVDGTMYFEDTVPKYQGAVSYSAGDNTIQINFGGSTVSLYGISIDFGDNYPTLFIIEANGDEYSFENNTRYFKTNTVFRDISYLMINPDEFVSGEVENRLRIYSVSFGYAQTFENNQIMNFTETDYVSSISDSVPSIDMTLTIDNSDQEYNPDDENSVLAFLSNGMELSVAMGYDLGGNGNENEIEWMPATTCYLSEWSANDSQAEFTATDRLANLDDSYYGGQYYSSGITLYALAQDVLSDAGIGTDEYYLDPVLATIKVKNPMPVVSHASALQIIANAGRCALYQGRDAKIYLKGSYFSDVTVTTSKVFLPIDANTISTEGFKKAYALPSNDFSSVDGGMYFLPSSYTLLDCGFVSYSTWSGLAWSDETPTITLTYEIETSVFGLQIYFREPYPKAFQIQTLDESGNVVETIECTSDQIGSDGVLSLEQQFQNFKSMVFTATKGYDYSRVFVDYIGFEDVSGYTLSRDTELTDSPTATRQNQIKSISVKKTSYSKSTGDSTTLTTEEATIKKSDPTYTVYLTAPSYGYSINVKDNTAITGKVTSSTAYKVEITFSGLTADTDLEFEVIGYTYETNVNDVVRTYNKKGDAITWENPLVSSNSLANQIIDFLSAYYLGDVEYSLSWRGDPRTDANDLFDLEIIKSSGKDTALIRSYQNQIAFNGSWSGSMKARRVVKDET